MARVPNSTDYTIDVDGVGRFTIGRRKMADELAIQREYAAILGGVEPTRWLETVGSWLSTFRVLIVFAPSGWNVDEMDPLEEDSYERMKRVYNAISEKELSFRHKSGAGSEGRGQETAGDNRVPVSPEV